MTDADALPRRFVAGYALGSVGTGGFGTLPGLLLAYYLTDTLGVAAGAAVLAVTLPKIWDVVIDPFVGAASDADARRTGDRRRFLLLGALTLPVLLALTFAVPAGLGPTAAVAWVVVLFVGAATAFSLFQVPYIALPAEATSGYHARTRLMGWRVAVLAVAILLFGAGGPALRDAGGGGPRGYLLMGSVAGAVVGLGMLATWWGTPRGTHGPHPVPGRRAAEAPRDGHGAAAGWRAGLRAARTDRPFRALLGVFVLQALATGAMLAGAQYVATYVLRQEAAVSILFVALVGPALLVMPAWTAVARRTGKERAYALASTLFAAASLSMVALLAWPGAWVYASVALAGVAYAGMQALPLAMLPDVLSTRARRTGAGDAGALSGVWTAGETAALAVGPGLVLTLLALGGFVSRTAGEAAAQQPASAVAAVVASFSVLPAALVGASLVVLRGYRLRAADVDTAPEEVAP